MDKHHNIGDYNTGHHNTGHHNTGSWNEGPHNVGDRNDGGWNTGECNAGYNNTGKQNVGHHNAGNQNIGHYNTGYQNIGSYNTGTYNTGDHNTGSWNNGDRNVGYCNATTPKQCLIFNKPATFEDWNTAVKPNWMYVRLTKWIKESDMTDKEKEAYPSYVTTGGYLKCYTSLKQAYIEAWYNTSEEDRQLTRLLPNFDIDVFKDVFGFTPLTKGEKLSLLKEQLTNLQNQIKELE